jgi:hypothetical protein
MMLLAKVITLIELMALWISPIFFTNASGWSCWRHESTRCMPFVHIDCIDDWPAGLLQQRQIKRQQNDCHESWYFCEIASSINVVRRGFSFQSDALSH